MSDERPIKLSFTPMKKGSDGKTYTEDGKPFRVQYNPTELKIARAMDWKDAETFGPGGDMLQFTRAKPITLSMELTFDTTFQGAGEEVSMSLGDRLSQGVSNVAAAATSAVSSTIDNLTGAEDSPDYSIDETAHDVRTIWIARLEAMAHSECTKKGTAGKKDNSEWSSPPVVLVKWDKMELQAVITKLDTTYTMFGSDGVPVRAKVTLELKEQVLTELTEPGAEASPMLSAKVQLLNPNHGENIYSLAMSFGLDWRMIALANNIDDPTDIADNMDLIIPMVTGGKI